MKRVLIIILTLIIGLTAHSQNGSGREKKFELEGTLKSKVQMPPGCGVIAWGTVVEFEVIHLVGMKYPSKSIGIVVTCPESYSKRFFEVGKTYKVIFSDQNQADFSWSIPNVDVLKKNGLPFTPFAISIKRLQ